MNEGREIERIGRRSGGYIDGGRRTETKGDKRLKDELIKTDFLEDGIGDDGETGDYFLKKTRTENVVDGIIDKNIIP